MAAYSLSSSEHHHARFRKWQCQKRCGSISYGTWLVWVCPIVDYHNWHTDYDHEHLVVWGKEQRGRSCGMKDIWNKTTIVWTKHYERLPKLRIYEEYYDIEAGGLRVKCSNYISMPRYDVLFSLNFNALLCPYKWDKNNRSWLATVTYPWIATRRSRDITDILYFLPHRTVTYTPYIGGEAITTQDHVFEQPCLRVMFGELH